jgi:Na+/melibiose symporter-like transporter
MGADFSALFKNKPWLIMLAVTVLVFITLALKNGSHIYYFENYVDKKALSDFISPILSSFSAIGFTFFDNDAVSAGFGLFNSCGIIMMIIGILFSKHLADKFGKRDVFKYALLVSATLILSFVFIDSSSVAYMFLLQSLFGFFYGITIPILWAMVADVSDYMEWKMNRRATALTFSAMMVGLKAGLSIGGALVVSILNGYGYLSKGSATISAVIEQSPSVAIGTKMLVSVFSALPFFISVVLMFFYVIDKKMENRIENELKQTRNN